MACPFFHPTESFQDGVWLKPPRLPLGDPCLGHCIAGDNGPVQPELDDLRQYCNIGYARGRCSRFPVSPDAADAIRFSVTRDEGGQIGLVCILEREYSPIRHTPLVFTVAPGVFNTCIEQSHIEAQARKFVESYLSRRVKA